MEDQQTSLFDFDKPDIQELPSDDDLKAIIKARWLACVCDPYSRPQDWLKASEFLGKAIGIFIDKSEVKHSGNIDTSPKTLDSFYSENG